MVTLVSACHGVGKTSVAIQLAAALSASGARVLLIDENRGPASAVEILGLPSGFALENVTRGECSFEHAMRPTAHGVTVLSVASTACAVPALRIAMQERLMAGLRGIDTRFDVVLADTVCGGSGGMTISACENHDMIVVSSAATQSVTATYALIKRLRDTHSEQRLHVLLNRVVREENARVILENLTGVARSHLQMSIASLGCVPKDEKLRFNRAGCGAVVETHPASASAARFRGIADAIIHWPGTYARSGLVDRFMQHVFAGSAPALASAGV
jgi:flagellar biosynthesis protein FlhG